jgi:hypothetical protein
VVQSVGQNVRRGFDANRVASGGLVKFRRQNRVLRMEKEIRWSHGRFAQTPEAKVYLDPSYHDAPGYVRL